MPNNEPTSSLRQRAEEIAREKEAQSPDHIETMSSEEIRRMFHELRVHQIELEMQNEELRRIAISDISERKQAEASLLEAEWKFHALFEKGPIGVAYHAMIYDDSGKPIDYRFLDVNESYRELTGVDPRGKTVKQAFPGIENDPFDWIGTYGHVARTGESIRFEQYLESNGRWYDCVGYQYKLDHFVVAFMEITERKRAEQALRRNEAKHRKMVANIGDVIVIIDQNGINRYKSPNIEKWFGWRPEEAVGISALENVHSEDFNSAQRFIGSLMEKPNAAATTECRYRCKDGSYKWIEFTGINLLHDPDIEGVLGNYHDITERKQAEDDMHQTKAILQAAMDQSTAGIAIADAPSGTLRYVNDAGLLIRGGNRQSVVNGVGIDQYVARWQLMDFDGKPLKQDEVPLTRAILFGETCSREFIIRRDSDDDRIVLAKATPIRDDKGNLVAGIVIFMDITEHKRTEQALRASDARYRAVAQSAHDAIVTADSAGNIVDWNQGAEHIFGYTEIEASRQPLVMLLPSRYHDGHLAGMARMHAGGEQHIIGKIVAVEGRRKDGSEVPLELSLAEWQVADGRFYTAIIRDITQRKVLEEQFRQAQKLESIGQLAGGVAHDFNNILAVMMIRLNFMQNSKSLDHETQETVLDLTVDAKRAASLTRQLLLFSRRSVMEVELLNLNELMTNLLKMLRRLIGEHITVRFDSRDVPTNVEADAVMIEQVLMNLSVNARDAMSQGGNLTINIESVQIDEKRVQGKIKVQLGQFVCLSMADTGCGMDETTLKRIFEPFFTTKEVGKGTGLGLATVHSIVAQHKGWVEVESELGRGTTFKVFLPATTKRKAEPTQTEKTAVIRGHETILLVEDETHLRQMVAKGLRRFGYCVLEASNGQTAMKLWQENSQHIDLLFSDMRMPEGMTGLDLAEKLRKEIPNLKVIISSGYNVELAGQGLPSPGDIVYFTKPYEFEVLLKTIRDCLDRA